MLTYEYANIGILSSSQVARTDNGRSLVRFIPPRKNPLGIPLLVSSSNDHALISISTAAIGAIYIQRELSKSPPFRLLIR